MFEVHQWARARELYRDGVSKSLRSLAPAYVRRDILWCAIVRLTCSAASDPLAGCEARSRANSRRVSVRSPLRRALLCRGKGERLSNGRLPEGRELNHHPRWGVPRDVCRRGDPLA